MTMRHLFLSTTLLLGAILPVAGQDARLYRPETGLSSSQVNRIYQDRRDYIWICTEGGLVRFDGMRFETYQHDRERANCLASSSVIDIVEDRLGNKWIGTAAGVDMLDSEYASFTHLTLHRNPDTPVNPYIGRLLEIPGEGDSTVLLVATGGSGVFVIDCETRRELSGRREQIQQYLHTDYVHSLFLDGSGRLWIIPGDGIPVILDPVSLQRVEGPAWSPELGRNGEQFRIIALAEDPVTGNILLGSSQGLLIYKAGSNLVRKVSGPRAAATVAASVIFDSQAASGEERLFLVREHVLRPQNRAFRVVVEDGHDRVAVGRIFIVVALDERHDRQRAHDLEAFVRIGVVSHDVAEGKIGVHRKLAAAGKHGLQRLEIGVDVAQDRIFHRVFFPGCFQDF